MNNVHKRIHTNVLCMRIRQLRHENLTLKLEKEQLVLCLLTQLERQRKNASDTVLKRKNLNIKEYTRQTPY